jgi:hypothetical protein
MIPYYCRERLARRVSAEFRNLAKISHVIPRASEAAIRARDSSGRIAAVDAIADATIVAVAAARSAVALAEDAPVRVSNAAALAGHTVIRADIPAHRGAHNSSLKC